MSPDIGRISRVAGIRGHAEVWTESRRGARFPTCQENPIQTGVLRKHSDRARWKTCPTAWIKHRFPANCHAAAVGGVRRQMICWGGQSGKKMPSEIENEKGAY